MGVLHRNNPYRKIYEQHYGAIPKGYHIHHIDGNPLNNAIENLQCLSAKDHEKIHGPFAGMASMAGKKGARAFRNSLTAEELKAWHIKGGKASRNSGGYAMSEQGKENIRKARLKSKKYKCIYGCSKTFDGGNLRNHMEKIHGIQI